MHVRVDCYQGGEFQEYWAKRTEMPGFHALTPQEVTAAVGRSIAAVLEQRPLF